MCIIRRPRQGTSAVRVFQFPPNVKVLVVAQNACFVKLLFQYKFDTFKLLLSNTLEILLEYPPPRMQLVPNYPFDFPPRPN